MHYKTEIIEERQKGLIVSKKIHGFISHLKKRLKNSSVEYFFSSRPKSDLTAFDYCFFVDEHMDTVSISNLPKKKLIFILLNRKRTTHKFRQHPKIKVISIDDDVINTEDLDKILWFAFSKTNENGLNISHSPFSVKKINRIKPVLNFHKYLTVKTLINVSIIAILFFHFVFVIPLLLSFGYGYLSYRSISNEDFKSTQISQLKADRYLLISKNLYNFSRPTFLLFGLAGLPDDALEFNTRALSAIAGTVSVLKEADKIRETIFIKNKIDSDKSELSLRFKKIGKSLETLNQDLNLLSRKLPSYGFLVKAKSEIINAIDLIGKSEKMIGYFETQITAPSFSKYLIFFANNRELRPGGGFIGSFGILELGNFEIREIRVYDVYDADGQLNIHIDPPAPLSKYLGVPHWFLRDSNFSPDFVENFEEALFFLEKEMDLKDFQGSILITTTAIENLLSAFGDIYIPDYKEYINSKNFYLKTQFHVEKDFFPGSTQKRNFLSSLINQIFINFDQVSFGKLGREIKKSFDEKQITVFVKDATIQSFFDTSFWSGRVIEPACTIRPNCISDYVFPYDANVGANKANFFVNKNLYLKTVIDQQGKISHQMSIRYQNDSPSYVFPTGLYRNYFQILLPRKSIVDLVTKNGVKVDEIDQKDDKYKVVGFFFQVAPGEVTEIKINYSLTENIGDGEQIYQFVIQKQIGASNSDFVLKLDVAKNISVLNQNFSPVVKDREIIYNTNLSTDKIFLIELMKQ